jgi:CCR4-NOT transcription complex subunit 2
MDARQELLLGNLLGRKRDPYLLLGMDQTQGCDLQSLNLNLSSQQPIHHLLMTPYSDSTIGADLPCKNYPFQLDLQTERLSDETLFYMFYSITRDVLQEIASQELYKRSWRFHKDFKLWLCKDSKSEHFKGPGFERGLYIFFDPNSWALVKKEWVLYYDQLEQRS